MGGVPRGCLWRFTEAATDLPRTCAVDFCDLHILRYCSAAWLYFLPRRSRYINTFVHDDHCEVKGLMSLSSFVAYLIAMMVGAADPNAQMTNPF